MISNFKPQIRRINEGAGAKLDEFGRANGFGKFPVCCGAFEVSPRVLQQMRRTMKIGEPLTSRSATSSQTTNLPEALFAQPPKSIAFGSTVKSYRRVR